jgi:hypothetical protein
MSADDHDNRHYGHDYHYRNHDYHYRNHDYHYRNHDYHYRNHDYQRRGYTLRAQATAVLTPLPLPASPASQAMIGWIGLSINIRGQDNGSAYRYGSAREHW